MAIRNYINSAPLLTITGSVLSTDVTLTVSSTSGYPTAPFTLALERGTANEEVCLCTAKTGTTFTVTRGYDGTTAKAHNSGAPVEHTTSAQDYSDANAHIFNTARNDHTQYLLNSVYTAKGSILVATGAGVPANMAVGADGTTIIAASGQANGVNWGTVGTASITANAVTFAKLDATTQQAIIQKLTTGSLPGSPVAGQVVATTDNGRIVGWLDPSPSWQPLAYGVGRIYTSTGNASGGQSGDLWIKYV